MHGRLKVKTTAEKEAERTKEREKKKAVYLGAMAKIRQLFNSGDRSEKLLILLGQVLEKVPEFTTLWNWRRTVLGELLKERDVSSAAKERVGDGEDNGESAEKKEDVKQVTEEDKKEKERVNGLVESEKKFVVRCLEVNPKAYALWLHRRWLVSLNPTDEEIKKEVDLCNLYLKFDERNFHCWDYRRFIVDLGGISKAEELRTTTALIERNFSNYSAWHYRSTLLDTGSPDTVNRELEWTQNAYFTDPSDQSIWLYYQWLLGRNTPTKPSLLAAKRDVRDKCDVIILHVLLDTAVTEPPPSLQVTPTPIEGSWRTATGSKLLSCTLPNSSEDVIIRMGENSIELRGEQCTGARPGGISPITQFTAAPEVLTTQLENIRELYELEPDNKWVLLTTVAMEHALNLHKTKEQIKELREMIVKLCQVDPMRSSFYKDHWSRILLETALTAWWSRDMMTSRDTMTSSLNHDIAALSLSKKYLTRLVHTDYMFAVRKLDLSSNALFSLVGFSAMTSLEDLNVSNNKITSLEGLEGCQSLRKLDASGNLIWNPCGVLACTKCRIVDLRLSGNPLCEGEMYPGCVKDSCLMLCSLDGVDL